MPVVRDMWCCQLLQHMDRGSAVQQTLPEAGHELQSQVLVEAVTSGSQLILIVADVEEQLKPKADAHDGEVVTVFVKLITEIINK